MSRSISILVLVSLLVSVPLCLCHKSSGGYLYPQFYDQSCPRAQEIVKCVIAKAVARDPRMAASLLRLHFHDCFVKVVSCADIMALAARDSTVLVSALGRRDSRDASLSGSNHNIPAPNNTFQTILTKFKLQGLNIVDLVALSGSHTIGNSRCTSFRQRLYNQTGNGQSDYTLDQSYAAQLRTRCPRSGGDQNLFFLDFVSPFKFDNSYFRNLLADKGLLNSDQVLVTKSQASLQLVKQYAESNELFFEQFAKSMVKMGNISPLTGSHGEIRKSCRKTNS